ncbi:hypothetical protein LIER_06388 [Lithospermum erythrorhizon]|uniref:Uncharacterized protein n=1 Tax=Lithospermum erythrorhizon TaxID=34254 RepID=A0AAV3P5F4_LITER
MFAQNCLSMTYLTQLSCFSRLIFGTPKIDKVAEDRWHSKWWFVKGGMDEAVPRVWVPLGGVAVPVKPKKMSTTIRAHLETLRRVFDRPLHYKVFCEEGVLIQAGLIQSKEFDPTSGPPFCWGITHHNYDLLQAAEKCVEPKDIPFSTMTGERRPAFRKTKRLQLLGIFLHALLTRNVLFPLESLLEDVADSGPKASIARYLIKALNASHSLSRRVDTLDNERAEARKGEQACRLHMQGIVQEKELRMKS